MKSLALAVLIAAAATLAAGNAHALSLAIDIPTQFTLKTGYLDKNKSAKVEDRTVTDVSGYKVLIAGENHIGFGYESYEWNGRAKSVGAFDVTFAYQFYDVFLDLPTKFLNYTLGYGIGRASATIDDDQGGSPTVKSAAASQWFVGVGWPFGEKFDLHAAYHVIATEGLEVSGGGKAQGDGSTLMFGARFGW